MSLDTACFSMNSDISNLISGSAVSKSSFASCFTSSVLPTPVGPTNRNDAGRFLPEIAALFLFIAFATSETASS